MDAVLSSHELGENKRHPGSNKAQRTGVTEKELEVYKEEATVYGH